MKEVILKLNKEIDELYARINALDKAVDALELVRPDEKQLVANMVKEMSDLEHAREKLLDAVKALQAVCKHEWVPDGHDSHKDYEKCHICNETRSC